MIIERNTIRWILATLMCFAVLVSVLFFQHQSLRLDEAQSLWQTSHTPSKIIEIIGKDVHVPLYHLLLHVWQLLFGNGVIAGRLFSLMFFIASIPVVYLLGARMFDRRIGVFSAVLFTISPFMNWYGNEIRMYSLFVFLTLINTYFFLGIYRHNDERSWIGFTLSALFGVYCHYFFFLVLLTDLLFYGLYRQSFARDMLKRIRITMLLVIVAFLPWTYNVLRLGGASETQPLLPTPTSINFFNTLSQFIFGFQTDYLNTFLLSLWPLTIFLGFLALRKNRRIPPEVIYVTLLFLLPNVLTFFVSISVKPIYVTRYLIFTLPMMYILLSWLIYRYSPRITNIFRIALVCGMIILLIGEAVSAATPVKENYREVAEFLEREARPSDVIVVSAPFTIYPMLYYYKGPSALETLPYWSLNEAGGIPPYSEEQIASDLEKIRGQRANMWVLLSYDQGYEEALRIYLDTHLERTFEQQFAPKMNLYRYKLRYE